MAVLDTSTTITAFKQQLNVRGYARATIENYAKSLDLFKSWLTGRGINDLKCVTAATIAAYQQHLMTQNNAMATKALKIRAVKRLFEYLEKTHRLLINPAESIVEIRSRHRRIGPVLTMDEVKKLLARPDLSTPIGIRDRAVMEVFYATAIRLSELLYLEIYHVELKEKLLYVRRGKGNKQRVVPLGNQAMQYLLRYLEQARPVLAAKNPVEQRLFLLNNGLAMTPACVRGLLCRYRKPAGITKNVSPHTLRRSCATHLLQNGADIRHIQKLLGHRRLSTTEAYTKIMPLEVKKMHQTTHPGIKEENHADPAIDTHLPETP